MILAKPNHIKIYGHRGGRGDLPENTLDSFKYLFENNINAYETDILISKDLIPVITHDFRLDPSLTKDDEGNWITDDNIKIFDLTNISINETLSRTIITSATTLLALLSIFIFGGEILKGFSFAMILGVIIGTYSSIYIANPILVMLNVTQKTIIKEDTD